jgi:hypothetical protein
MFEVLAGCRGNYWKRVRRFQKSGTTSNVGLLVSLSFFSSR